MKRLATLLLASTFLTCAPAPARAEPISSAIGLTALLTSGLTAAGVGTVAAGTAAAAIGGAIVTTAITVGANLLVNAFLPEQQQPSEQAGASRGTTLNVQYGGALPRSAIMGRGATGGHHIYANVCDHAGHANNLLQCVFVIGDGLHGKLLALTYNGKACTLPANPDHTNYDIPEFIDIKGSPFVTIRYYRGFHDQTADSLLVSRANPAGRWTSNHRGRGVCYLIVDQVYNEELGLTGVPQLLIETEGLALYDPRKDSTVGGSGSHVWGNELTYEPSTNPAVQEYNYRRGVFIESQRILGMTVAASNLILSMYFAAANACDEAVPLKEGGTEPRYRAACGIADDRQHSAALEAIRGAMAGMSLERAGQFGPIAGVSQVPITDLTITDDDLEVGTPAPFSKYRSRTEVATAVHGTFSDPAQQWAPVAFPAREDAADDAAYGEKLARALDLTQVFSSSQAQRIAEINRRRSLQLGRGSMTVGAKWIAVQPGDWLPLNSVRHGSMTVLITAVRIDPARHNVTLSYERIASSVYSWTTAGELDAPATPAPALPGTITTVAAGMAAVGVSVPADNGLVHPGIRFMWTPILDQSVDAIQFEIRKVGDTNVIGFVADFPDAGIAVCSAGIQANTVYEYRHRLTTTPWRECPWSDWDTVTSGTDHVVPMALEAAIAEFNQGLQDRVENQLAALGHMVDDIEQRIAHWAAEQDAHNAFDVIEEKTVIEARVETETANAVVQATSIAAVNTEAAIAQYDLSVGAQFGGLSSVVTETALAVATINGALLASYAVTLDVNGRVSGFKLLADNTTAIAAYNVDHFVIGAPGVSDKPVFAISVVTPEGTGVPQSQITMKGDLIADGTLTARMVTAGMINAVGIIAQNVVVTGNLQADAATRVDAAQNASVAVPMTTANTQLVTLMVSSVGGQFVITAQVTLNHDWGTNTPPLTLDADGWSLSVWLEISPAGANSWSTAKTIVVPAYLARISSDAAGNVALVGWRSKGHFTVIHKTQLARGNWDFRIMAAATVNKGGSVTVLFPTIVAMESRGFY